MGNENSTPADAPTAAPAQAPIGSTASRLEPEPASLIDAVFGWFQGLQKPQDDPSSRLSVHAPEESIGKETADDPRRLYELLRQIGKGSYGKVYSGRERKTDELVALKVLDIEEGEEIDKLLGEIESLRRCSSIFVLRYISSHLVGTRLWIVTELCEASLADIMQLRRAPLTEEQAHTSTPYHASPTVPYRYCGVRHLTSPHLTSPQLHLASPHLTSPHLTSPHHATPRHITSYRRATQLHVMQRYATHRHAPQHSTTQLPTQPNPTQPNTTQHNTAEYNTTQHSTTQRNTTQHSITQRHAA